MPWASVVVGRRRLTLDGPETAQWLPLDHPALAERVTQELEYPAQPLLRLRRRFRDGGASSDVLTQQPQHLVQVLGGSPVQAQDNIISRGGKLADQPRRKTRYLEDAGKPWQANSIGLLQHAAGLLRAAAVHRRCRQRCRQRGLAVLPCDYP